MCVATGCSRVSWGVTTLGRALCCSVRGWRWLRRRPCQRRRRRCWRTYSPCAARDTRCRTRGPTTLLAALRVRIKSSFTSILHSTRRQRASRGRRRNISGSPTSYRATNSSRSAASATSSFRLECDCCAMRRTHLTARRRRCGTRSSRSRARRSRRARPPTPTSPRPSTPTSPSSIISGRCRRSRQATEPKPPPRSHAQSRPRSALTAHACDRAGRERRRVGA